eukprot:Awhi_evm1s8522
MVYEKYIELNSRSQVNLEFAVVEKIQQGLQEADIDLFENAKNSILDLINRSSFPRFTDAVLSALEGSWTR